ncbi:acyl-ACP--UDP-N- acetylglucosamine O-acyltransferase [Agromyces protaetiae]|uniref:Acyl-ACP--UDP-N- acetylglucosamine O-acyltransferase n=1 Tax=Agromyces protaetiae TaxID=2509455 RepID=A0A4P6FEA2_9MICO|nr:acyl-ACP--UDP-N- acetylglucosamine O-acyltransferase [Agromyces protaetiae]QAY74570.1 acyl-ACP--UDP-N- acetylglucosamine O-acyltransferase [Agromyces protaetiae]
MNDIHPTAVIAGDVRIGADNTIGPFVVITGPVDIGDGNWIGAGVVIGAPPEVRSYPHPTSVSPSTGNGVRIGDRNVIREYAQIHQGWKGRTTVGDDAFIMNQVYVAHDGSVGDGASLASSVLLAGHVTVGAGANLGLGTAVHQFRTVGRGAMVGMSSVVTRDIPPYAKAFGSPASVRGANAIGMERAGRDPELIALLAAVYAGQDIDVDAILDDDLRSEVGRWIAERDSRARR